MQKVRPKKFLGQHFLKDPQIAQKIVDALTISKHESVVMEIGPGMGILSALLIEREPGKLILIEIDHESVIYLQKKIEGDQIEIIEGDFLKTDLRQIWSEQLSVIGNFPYNISSQIFFKIYESRKHVGEVVCMVQKEVAQRICAPHGNKTYGILSVLLGAFYSAEILFKVPPGVFHPPPKVDSAVMRLRRNPREDIGCDEKLFKKIVKQGFQNRRKTLRNALKPLFLPSDLTKEHIFDLRAEQLSVEDFIELTKKIESWIH